VPTRAAPTPETDAELAALADAWETFVRAHRRARDRRRKRDTGDGLTLSQYSLIRPLLDERAGLPPGRLAELGAVTPASATGMLDGLEAAGLVERTRAGADRRSVTVRLTPAGRRLAQRKYRELDAQRRRFFAGLDPSERPQTERTLRQLAELMEQL
jgi:DNA-binding MarR family transcriptional regulator